jgi:hypothetical protein
MGMNYLQMIKDAQTNGKWNERTMWSSVENISEMLESYKELDKQGYWNFIRKQYGTLHGRHYGEDFAMWDVSQMKYTKDGKTYTGAHWTCEEIEEATKNMSFPSGVTKWDKYVAFNSFYIDMCKDLSVEQILKGAYDFYFADEDWSADTKGSPTKVWDVMSCKYERS